MGECGCVGALVHQPVGVRGPENERGKTEVGMGDGLWGGTGRWDWSRRGWMAWEVVLEGGTEVGVGDGLGSGTRRWDWSKTVDALALLIGYGLAAVD